MIGLERHAGANIGTHRQVRIDPSYLCLHLQHRLVGLQAFLMDYLVQMALMLATRRHGHGDAHGGGVPGRLGPGVVGNGHGEGQGAVLEIVLHDPAIE